MRIAAQVLKIHLSGCNRIFDVVHRVRDVIGKIHDLSFQTTRPWSYALTHPFKSWAIIVVYRILPQGFFPVRTFALRPGVLANRIKGCAREIQASGAFLSNNLRLKARDDSQCLRIPFKASDFSRKFIECAFTIVSKWRMPEVVGKTCGIDNIGVGSQFLPQLASHLRNLKGVSQARAHEIVRGWPQDLRFFTQTSQC